MTDISREDIEGLSERLDKVEAYLHVDEKRGKVAELEKLSAEPGFWEDAEGASKTMEQLTRAKEDVVAIDSARAELEDVKAALELGEETGDEDLLAEASSTLERLVSDLGELELST